MKRRFVVKASTVQSAKIPKTKAVKVLQGNYGYGWDDLCEYGINDFKEIRDDLKAYRENEPGYSFRVIQRRVPNPEYKETDDVQASRKTKSKAINACQIMQDINQYQPWSGAVDTYNNLLNFGLWDAFVDFLDSEYYNDEAGEGVISETSLNDLLWFEPAFCYEVVGLYYNAETDEVSDEPFEDDEIEESTRISRNKKRVTSSMSRKKNKITAASNKKLFYGVPGVEFIWHGEWNDPEVCYEGELYNYYDVEEGLLSYYREICEEQGINDPNDEGFDDWIRNNPDYVYNELYDLTPTGPDNRTPSLSEVFPNMKPNKR